MSNTEIAELLRRVAAAYQILNENRFKIIAYERAADSIEHLTSDLKDYWDEGKLGDIPGVGESIAGYLDEFFKTGKVKHFDQVLGKLPASIYPLLLVPGIGPKKAYKLVQELKLHSAASIIDDLEKAAKAHRVSPIEGFGEKSEADILANIETYRRGQIKENRMVLPEADAVAKHVIEYLQKNKAVERADALGSLRRQVSTIGDIDIAVATKKPAEVVSHFVGYPHRKLIEEGPTGASLLLHNGRQVDLRVQKPEAYGAMLQYFTGSKHHNIKLREYALTKGKSLNEYGIKDLRTKKLHEFASEEAFYKTLGLAWVPPELREDRGEIEAALTGKLPAVVETADIRGDLHVHSNYNLEPSHDLGADDMEKYLDQAASLGYDYVGFSDHNPSLSKHTEKQIIDIMKKRKAHYEQKYYSWEKHSKKRVHMFLMCEVDIQPDGKLALPADAFEYVDGVIVSLHSSFTLEKKQMTGRVVRALESHPKVRIFGHPTARLLGKREGVELEWKEIFSVCKSRDIALEINAYPQRLDLPDTIVFDARKAGIKFCIDTDSHAAGQMPLMEYGVSVARRGWATKHDIVNAMGYNDFRKWLVNSF